jgi:hypothetical protein
MVDVYLRGRAGVKHNAKVSDIFDAVKITALTAPYTSAVLFMSASIAVISRGE